MMHGSGAIDAIREFRAEFGCGLMEAKVMWDRHHSLDKMREAMRESGIPELDNVRADRLQRELIELTALREAEAAELIELRMRFSDCSAPNGWKLVPVTPTEEMIEAGYGAACRHDYGDVVPSLEIAPATYTAMLAAAPEAPK